MAQPISPIDWSSIIAVSIPCVTFLAAAFKYIDAYFRHKRDEKQEFIERIVESTVTKTYDKVLGDVQKDVQLLFKYREDDRKHYDTRFDSIMTQLKK